MKMRTVLATFLAAALATLSHADSESASLLSPTDVDRMIEDRLKQVNLAPAPLADDATFLRRLSLDVRGVVPTLEEALEFQKADLETRRAEAIRRFLHDPARGERWADYWDKLLVGVIPALAENPTRLLQTKQPFKEWVARSFNENRRFDSFAKEIITAEGPITLAPAALPIARWDNSTPDVAGTMTRVFLGKQTQCAQCHDHPYDSALSQENFWELAAFFERAEVREIRDLEGRPRDRQVLERLRGETAIPDMEPEVTVQPKWLDGKAGRTGESLRRRQEFAGFLTNHDRKQFARNLVNRMWAHYLGRGIVDPVDSWEGDRLPMEHGALLDALAGHFIASGMDVRALEELIVSTKTYQRAVSNELKVHTRPEVYAAATLRPLTPEQLFDSLDVVLGMTDRARRARGEDAAQRLLGRYLGQFLFLFGNDEMEFSTDLDVGVAQSLFFFNDGSLNDSLANARGSLVRRITQQVRSPEEQIAYLYAAALSRLPSPEESRPLIEELASLPSQERAQYLEDVLWALLNSAEFRTNH